MKRYYKVWFSNGHERGLERYTLLYVVSTAIITYLGTWLMAVSITGVRQ